MRVSLLLICGALLITGCRGPEGQAVAEIEGLGGTVEFDNECPGKPVVAVDLHGAEVSDALLARIGNMAQLRNLNLGGTTVGNQGVAHLSGLTRLEELNLTGTQVSDAGLEHLAGLTELRELGLGADRITDAGLAHLHGLRGYPGRLHGFRYLFRVLERWVL
jgi:hypothetical protein